MPKVTDEDLTLESGLPDDFDAYITSNTYFGVKEDYTAISQKTTPMLILCLEGPHMEKPLEQAYSTGEAKAWEITRNGREVVSHKNPNSHRFVENSRAGGLVKRFMLLIGKGDIAAGQAFFKARDRWMTEAEYYVGLGAHWKREKMDTVGGDARDVLMPVTYLGEASQDKVNAAPGAPGATAITELELALLLEDIKGLTLKDAKQALLKKRGPQDAIVQQVYNRGLLDKLEKEGKLAKDTEGKYV